MTLFGTLDKEQIQDIILHIERHRPGGSKEKAKNWLKRYARLACVLLNMLPPFFFSVLLLI